MLAESGTQPLGIERDEDAALVATRDGGEVSVQSQRHRDELGYQETYDVLNSPRCVLIAPAATC